jgi:hypothetical protein
MTEQPMPTYNPFEGEEIANGPFKEKPKPIDCPRCGKKIKGDKGDEPAAISRWDNVTEVCAKCSDEESLDYPELAAEDKKRRDKKDFTSVIHPTKGYKPWVTPPKGLESR